MKLASRPPTRRGLVLATLAVILLGTALTAWLQPWDNSHAVPKVAANDYSGRPTACLAADDSVASAQVVQHTWTVLQQAGKDNPVNVQQLVVTAKGPEEAAPYLSGLVAQHCTLIVTAGSAFDGAVPAAVKVSPHVRFAVVDPPAGVDLKGATALTGDQLVDQLGKNVHDLAAKH
ncbi:hypothetical protein ACI1MP_31400 [Kitasatospora griseola]|uniref:hypothetical protein n=1 Tax=Kitasatospora griseola TaxID=2064 RepID=UPI003855A405